MCGSVKQKWRDSNRRTVGADAVSLAGYYSVYQITSHLLMPYKAT